MSEKEVKEFFEWLINIGCPVQLMPSENKIKEALRAKILSVEDLKARFRPVEEARKIREENLRVELCKIKRGNFLIADKKGISWEYMQYLKLNNTKKEIERVERNIEELKNDFDCKKQQLADKNVQKRQLKENVEKNVAKMRVHKMNNMILSEEIQEVKENLSKCDSAMYPLPDENCNGSATLQLLTDLLVKYYARCESLEQESETSEAVQNALWEEIVKVLKKTPNSVICRELLNDLNALVESTKALKEKNMNVPNEEKDPLYLHIIGYKNFLVNRLKLLIQFKHNKDKIANLMEIYAETFDDFGEMLVKKISHFSPQFVLEYRDVLIKEAVFRGKIALLKDEVQKYQISSLDNSIPEEFRRITKQVKMFNEKFLTEAKKAEKNLYMLKHVAPKLEYTIQGNQSLLNSLRRQIAIKAAKKKNSTALANLEETTSRNGYQLITEDVTEEKQNSVVRKIIPEPEVIDFPLPCSKEDCEDLARRVAVGEASHRNTLMQIENLGLQTRDILTNAQIHCNFLIDNPMRKYVPPTMKFNGHTYQQYETEFMLHYRQTDK